MADDAKALIEVAVRRFIEDDMTSNAHNKPLSSLSPSWERGRGWPVKKFYVVLDECVAHFLVVGLCLPLASRYMR